MKRARSPRSGASAAFPDLALARGIRRVHFVGIGGSGMNGIAEILVRMGFRVTGSDLRVNPAVERLAALGCTVFEGHRAENAAGADVVVVSSAVPPDNPELHQARADRVPVIPRAEMLGELMRMKYAVGVAGAHGKTTTTAMAALLLHHAGMDPTVVIGGRLSHFDANARLGLGPCMVAEADESDGSFLKLFPTVAVVTNIDAEHLGHYGNMGNLCRAFVDYVNRVPFYGGAVLGIDNGLVRAMVPVINRRYVTFGFAGDARVRGENYRAGEEGSRFRVYRGKEALGEVSLAIPGRHNAQNALAVVAVGLELEIPMRTIGEALALFRGADRRFQTRGVARGVRVVDDYGHHPTEIRATLEAARGIARGRVIAVFQPHRYSRVHALWDDFCAAFGDADAVWCTEIYPAGEDPIPGVTGEALAVGTRCRDGKAGFCPSFGALARRIAREAAPGDLVITFGAGNIHQVCGEILSQLSAGVEK